MSEEDDFQIPEGSTLSVGQLKDLKAMALALYLSWRAVGLAEPFKEMIAFGAKCLSERWEMPRPEAEAHLGATLLFLTQNDWVQVAINRSGGFSYAATIEPEEVADDERLIEFFKAGLALLPQRNEERTQQNEH